MKSTEFSLPEDVSNEDAAVAAEGLGKNYRDTPWVLPRKDLALQHGAASIYESGKASVWGTGPKQLGGLGEGISLYFYILKYLSLYFFLASLLAVPHILISNSGEALDEQVVGQTSPLIKFTAINHADATAIQDDDEPSTITPTSATPTSTGYCKSTHNNLNYMTCDELHSLASVNQLALLISSVTSVDGDWDQESTEVISVTLAMLDCDLGCGCDFDLANQSGDHSAALSSTDQPTINTCADYYQALNPTTTLTTPTCAISGLSKCGKAGCGHVLLAQGSATFAEDSDCSCCMSEISCGEYNPSNENLNLAPLYNSTMTRDDASLLVSLCDIVYCILFVLLWKYMQRKVAIVVRQTDEDNVTAGDYTVCVSGLPPTATEEQVRKHFSDIYQLSEPDWSFKGYICGLWGKKKPRLPEECLNYDLTPIEDLAPVNDVRCHGKDNYKGSWVADVNIAHPNGKLIRRCQALKKYSNKLLEARAKVKKYSPGTPLKTGDNPKKLRNAEINLHLLEEKISKIHKSLQSSAASFTRIDSECLYAFVTFENEDSFLRCLEDYGRYSTRSLIRPWTWLIPPQPPTLRFDGLHHLTITESPEPSNIMWENLETTYISSLIRKTITATITITMLIISLALVILVKAVKKDVEAAVPDLTKCTEGLPAVFNTEAVVANYIWYPTFDSLCEVDSNFITVDGFFPDLNEDTDATDVSNYISYYKGTCVDPCISGSSEKITCIGYNGQELMEDTVFERVRSVSAYENGRLVADPEYFPFTRCSNDDIEDCDMSDYANNVLVDYPDAKFVFDDPLGLACKDNLDPSWVTSSGTTQKNCVQVQKQTTKGCFCLTAMIESIEQYGVLDGAQKLIDNYANVCGEFAKQYVLAQTLVIASAAMVTVINVLLKIAIKGMASFEHHKSLSNETKAISSQIAITMFVNTAIIIMIVHAAIDFSPLNSLGMLNGDADDFNFHWYVNVGSAIILTMAINSVTVHIGPIIGYYIVQPVKMCMAGVSATQRSLNKKVEGPEFEISTRFPMILNTLAVTMVFSSALPILLPIAFVACQLFYHVDKLLLLRFFKKPPAYDAKLASGTVHILPFILLVHCAFGTWVYSVPEVFQSTCIPVESFDYESYLNTAGDYDKMNMLPRILRRNVFPMFLTTIMLVGIIVYEYLGSYIVNMLLKGTVGNALKVVFAPFKKLWKCCCGNALGVDKEFNPPFTKNFVRGYPKGEPAPSLSSKAGWELTKDENNLSVHRKMWMDSGDVMGVRHGEGDLKKTWEAIRDTQVHTYNIRNNPKYTDAMIAKDELIQALGMNAGADLEEASLGQATPSKGNKVVPVAG